MYFQVLIIGYCSHSRLVFLFVGGDRNHDILAYFVATSGFYVFLCFFSGSLSSYKSRLQVDYEIGVERPANEIDSTMAPSSQTANDDGDVTMVAVGDGESVVWSNSSSNDLLF